MRRVKYHIYRSKSLQGNDVTEVVVSLNQMEHSSHTGITMGNLNIFSFCYTLFVAIVTMVLPQDFEIYARIFMYVTASVLSVVTIYYSIKNKGRYKR